MTPRKTSTSPTYGPAIKKRRIDPRTEATHAAILHAAIRLFAERGYRNTTVAAIAEVVGITDAGILHHFHTKDQLLREAVESIYGAQRQRFEELTAPDGLEAIRNLARWGYVMEERFGPSGALVLVLSAEAVAQDAFIHHFYAARYSEFVVRIAGLIRTGVRRGEIRDDVDAEFEARSLLAHFLGIRFLWMYMDKGFSIGSDLERHVTCLVQRIRAPRRRRHTAST